MSDQERDAIVADRLSLEKWLRRRAEKLLDVATRNGTTETGHLKCAAVEAEFIADMLHESVNREDLELWP